MLVSEEVEVKLNSRNIRHFENLGYYIPRIINKDGNLIVSSETNIVVKVSDLQLTSRVIIQVKCDYCNKEFPKDYCNYNIQRKNIAKDCCNDVNCMKKKRAESNLKIYGVENCLDIDGVRDKIKQTNIDKYGNQYAIASIEIKDKIHNTFIEKYGVENPFELDEVKNKIKETNLEKYGQEYYTRTEESKNRYKQTCLDKYGYENASQAPEIIEKIKDTQFNKYGGFYSATDEFKEKYKNTCQEKYGCDNTFQVEEFKEKANNTMVKKYGVSNLMKIDEIREDRIKKMVITKYKNGTMQTSRQQEYICMLIGGELNYPIDRVSADIVLLDEMIFCEYDGSGHDLSVKMGDISKHDFNIKETRRKYYLINKGWKEIRIISLKDLLPFDDVIIDMLEIAKDYFNSGHSWIKFDVDNSLIITSQYKMKVDYGILRKIKEKDLLEVG